MSPSLRGLRSTAEEDILDLFDENEERDEQAVQMEIQGIMSNIRLDLFGSAFKSTSRRNQPLSWTIEEERLMQEILEDEEEQMLSP